MREAVAYRFPIDTRTNCTATTAERNLANRKHMPHDCQQTCVRRSTFLLPASEVCPEKLSDGSVGCERFLGEPASDSLSPATQT